MCGEEGIMIRRKKHHDDACCSVPDHFHAPPQKFVHPPRHLSKRDFGLRTRRRFVITIAGLLLISTAGFWPICEFIVDTLRSTTFSKSVWSDSTHMGDVTTGKYCAHENRRWTCYDCNDGNCRIIRGRNKCPQFRRVPGDYPVPRASSADAVEIAGLPTRTLSWMGIRYYHEQPICTIAGCFNLERCSDTVLKVYVDHEGEHALLDYAAEHSKPIPVQRVHSANDACLIVVLSDTYSSVHDMKSFGHWNDGENHLLWDFSNFPDRKIAPDAPFNMFHVGKAIIASETIGTAYARLGYDLVLPLPRRWGRALAPNDVDIHRPRKYLLSFRGRVIDSIAAAYQHRWLAAEHWEVADDIVVDVECWHFDWLVDKKSLIKPYERSPGMFDDMMWNSTFGFTPGGSGMSSYRFGEVLSTGGIPVVVHGDFVPPLAPELDWSKCIVWVSEQRIIDLPHILRQIPPKEVHARQTACWKLHSAVFGEKEVDGKWYNDEGAVFTKGLQIIAQRVSSAVQMSKIVNDFADT